MNEILDFDSTTWERFQWKWLTSAKQKQEKYDYACWYAEACNGEVTETTTGYSVGLL